MDEKHINPPQGGSVIAQSEDDKPHQHLYQVVIEKDWAIMWCYCGESYHLMRSWFAWTKLQGPETL